MKFLNFTKLAAVIVVAFLLIPSKSNAQFEAGKSYAGPSLGFHFHGSTVIIGGNYEYGMEIKDFGNIGIGGIVRYYSYDAGLWSYSDILLGGQANYHFKMSNKKLDPWAGILLDYDIGSTDYSGPYSAWFVEPSYGGFFLGLHGGMRYWISPSMALCGRVSFGSYSYGTLDLGVDFKF